MLLQIPQSDLHNQVQITLRSEKWETVSWCDDSHKTLEIPVPPEVNEDDVEAIALFLDKRGQPDRAMVPICLKPRVVQSKVEKKEAPKPVKVEKPEPVKVEPVKVEPEPVKVHKPDPFQSLPKAAPSREE